MNPTLGWITTSNNQPRPLRPRHLERWTAAMLGGALLTFAGTASAYVPQQDHIDAIRGKLLELHDNQPELYRNNFSRGLNGPDGLSGPDGTPDGLGAFQFFRGENEGGAIYTSPAGAHAVYGAILQSWAAAGHETRYGYPSGEEQDADSGAVWGGCKNGDRAQYFWSFADDSPYLACYHWDSDETTWHRPVRF